MSSPVERSITVSAPQSVDHWSFSTSSSIDDRTAELPMLALIFTRKLRPIIIGSSSRWRILAGMIARPRATSSRTNSAGSPSRAATNSISGVISPRRAYESCVPIAPVARLASIQDCRSLGSPSRTSCPCGPLVSYNRTGASPPPSVTSRMGTCTSIAVPPGDSGTVRAS